MFRPRLSGKGLQCIYGRRSLAHNFGRFGIRLSSTTTLPRTRETAGHAPAQQRAQYPLSVMPTHMLLRSLFVATISSNRFLLIPALHLLSFLSKPNRSFLFNLDRNPVLKAVLKRTLYNQFCAGETEQETQACVKQLKDLGFKGVILTYAKEMVFDHKAGSAKDHGLEKGINGKAALHDADIEAWRQGTLRTLDLISKGDILALKSVNLFLKRYVRENQG